MSQKNETTSLILAFLITAGLLGGGFWWFSRRPGGNLGSLFSQGSNSPNQGASTPITPPPNQGNVSPQGSFSSVANVPAGLFNYGGSTSWAPLRLTVDSAIQAARPEFRLRYVDPVGSAPGSGAGIRMLLRDELAFAQSSRPISDAEYQQAQQRSLQLKQVPVAIDGLAVAVNPSLTVPGLTLAQLADIYRGQLTNWQDVGGPNLTIKPLSRPISAGGTTELFVETVLKGQPLGPTVQMVSTTTEALRRLAATPGGIYFASAPEIVPQCTIKPVPLGRAAGQLVPPYREPLVPPEQCPAQRNQLNVAAFQNGQYPLTRNLYVVIKQNGQVDQQAGEAYANFLLTAEGQDFISRAGFVRIR